MRGDLEHAAVALGTDRPEPLPLRPHGVGPALEDALGLLGTRVGREVDVGPLDLAPAQEVADDAADEVEPPLGRREALGERPRRVEDGTQPLVDHRATVPAGISRLSMLRACGRGASGAPARATQRWR